jgi:hypothetical protein
MRARLRKVVFLGSMYPPLIALQLASVALSDLASPFCVFLPRGCVL